MAQSRAKRNQRSKRQPIAAPTTSPEAFAAKRRRRAVVIAFLVVIGLAGILAISGPGDDGTGAPTVPGGEVLTER